MVLGVKVILKVMERIEVIFKYDAKPGYKEGDIISQSRPKDTPVIKGVSIEIHIATAYQASDTTLESTDV